MDEEKKSGSGGVVVLDGEECTRILQFRIFKFFYLKSSLVLQPPT